MAVTSTLMAVGARMITDDSLGGDESDVAKWDIVPYLSYPSHNSISY